MKHIVTVLACFFLVTTANAQTELVKNGSFEDPNFSLENWEGVLFGGSNGSISATTEEARTGTHSLKITASSGSWEHYVGIKQRDLNPAPNTEYLMTFYVKGTVPNKTDGEVEAKTTGNDVSLGVDSKNNTSPIRADNGEFILEPGTYNDWTKVEYYWNSGSGYSKYFIDIGSYSSAGGSYYLDDFSIVGTAGSGGGNTGGTDSGGGQDLVLNGDFENGMSRWGGNYWNQSGGDVEVSTEQARSGSHSLKIVSTGSTPFPTYVGFDQNINPAPNTEYAMTFYVKGTVPFRTDGEVEAEPVSGGDDVSLGVDNRNNTGPIRADDGEFVLGAQNYNDWTKVVYYWNSGSGYTDYKIDIGSYSAPPSTVYYIDDLSIVPASAVGVEELDEGIPSTFTLYQNYPNPFNPETTIRFDLAQSTHVTLTIYNAMGQEVETLVSEPMLAGQYQYVWQARNQPSGLYVYRLQAGSFTQTGKMTLLK